MFLANNKSHSIREYTLESEISTDALLFARERGIEQGFNITQHVLEQCIKNTERYAILHSSGEIRFAELPCYIAHCMTELKGMGLKHGDRCSIVSADSVHMAIAILSVMCMGCTAIIINPLLQNDRLLESLNESKSNVILADNQNVQAITSLGSKGHKSLFPTVIDIDKTARTDLDLVNAEDIIEEIIIAPTSPFDNAFGIFTSGTTGKSKLVIHRHLDFVVAAERYGSQVLNIDASDSIFSASRLSFAFGLHNLFNALFHGATAILSPTKIDAETVVKTVKRFCPTIMCAVPTIYQFILDYPYVDKASFGSLRLFVSAGEHLPSGLRRQWLMSFGLPILDSLGSTEAFSTYLSNLPDSDTLGATGKLIPGFDAKLIGEQGEICPNGNAGTLWVRGPTLLSSYQSDTPANLSQFKNGWFCTNDVFSRDSDGYYYYHGRSDEMFKVAGQWISPQEIEGVLLEHPDVKEVAVVPVGDSEKTIRPKAFVVLDTEECDNLALILKEISQARLEKWKYPHFIEFVSSLPKTSTGKIKRYILRENNSIFEDGGVV